MVVATPVVMWAGWPFFAFGGFSVGDRDALPILIGHINRAGLGAGGAKRNHKSNGKLGS